MKPGECPYAVSFDSEILKRVALEMLLDAGVEIMLRLRERVTDLEALVANLYGEPGDCASS